MSIIHYCSSKAGDPKGMLTLCGIVFQDFLGGVGFCQDWDMVTCQGCIQAYREDLEAQIEEGLQELEALADEMPSPDPDEMPEAWEDVPNMDMPGMDDVMAEMEPEVKASQFPSGQHSYIFTIDQVPDFMALASGEKQEGWFTLVCDTCAKRTHIPQKRVPDFLFSRCPEDCDGWLWPTEVDPEMISDHIDRGGPLPPILQELADEEEDLIEVDIEMPMPEFTWTGQERYHGHDDMSVTMLRLLRDCEKVVSLIPGFDLTACPFCEAQAIPRSIWIIEHAIAYLAWVQQTHLKLVGAWKDDED